MFTNFLQPIASLMDIAYHYFLFFEKKKKNQHIFDFSKDF